MHPEPTSSTSADPLFFDYDAAPAGDPRRFADPIRADLVLAHRRAWERLVAPGTWWTGPERLAIAAASRTAVDCAFCQARKAALSPMSVEGEHDGSGADALPPAALDAVHRIVTDATRLSKPWVEGLAAMGVPDTHYVELLSVVVSVRSIDMFHQALGLDLEPLPEAGSAPASGEPTRRRPAPLVEGEAWVPMLPARIQSGEYADLFPQPTAPFVIRALSLVPEAVVWLKDLSSAHYLDVDRGEMMDFGPNDRPLSRAQTELIAGRVSAVNECFY